MSFTDDQRRGAAKAFLSYLRYGEYVKAVAVLTELRAAGEADLAAELLQALHEGGSVTVNQAARTVEAGSIVIGYQGGRIG